MNMPMIQIWTDELSQTMFTNHIFVTLISVSNAFLICPHAFFLPFPGAALMWFAVLSSSLSSSATSLWAPWVSLTRCLVVVLRCDLLTYPVRPGCWCMCSECVRFCLWYMFTVAEMDIVSLCSGLVKKNGWLLKVRGSGEMQLPQRTGRGVSPQHTALATHSGLLDSRWLC